MSLNISHSKAVVWGILIVTCLASVIFAEPPSNGYGVPPSNGYSGGGGNSGYGSSGGGYGNSNNGHHYQQENYPPRPYKFNYHVNDHYSKANFQQQENSDGNTVRGQYKVKLPDGRTQIVNYNADWKTGFNAEVTYEGEAHYPEPPKGGYGNQQSYSPPQQSYGPPQQSYQPQAAQSYSAPSQSYGGPTGGY